MTQRTFEFNDKKFFIAHGDGLGPEDHGYKLMKSVFRNKFVNGCLVCCILHIGIGLANFFSRKSRKKTGNSDDIFLGEDKEWLIIFSRQMLAKEHVDYFIFGHRHLPMRIATN